MTQFYKENTNVECAEFDEHGYFIKNTIELVSKGTALGPEFTTHLYEPKEGYIGKYNKETDAWEDIKSNLGKEFYAPNGELFIIDSIEGEFPEWAVKTAPPEYDPETQTVLHKDDEWKVYDILIGTTYYDEDGNELTVTELNFELPENHTFDVPPDTTADNQTVKLINGKWAIYTACIAYLKTDCNQVVELADKSLLTDDYTLDVPITQFDEWTDGVWVTNQSNQYISEYNAVDDARSSLYALMVDPLISEARIKRLQGKDAEVQSLEEQALAARDKIIAENPWPDNPTV